MPRKAWQRIAIAILPIAICVSLVQIDRTTATSNSRRGTPLAARTPATLIQPKVGFATVRDLAKSMRTAPHSWHMRHSRNSPVFASPKANRAQMLQGITAPDPVVQSQSGSLSMPNPIRTFEGLDNINNVIPPDSNGDVSPLHYMQSVNTSLQIWDKNGTPLLQNPLPNNWFWSAYPNDPCAQTNDGDPIILYDQLANRWLFTQVAWPNGFDVAPFYQCIAVSKGGDAYNDGWWLYSAQMPNMKRTDSPKFGIWPDGYYMAANQFTAAGDWGGAIAMVFERDKMLSGHPQPRFVYFDLLQVNSSFGLMLPADLDGPPPPAGAPNYFMEVDDADFIPPDDALSIWQFHVNWNNTANSTFGISSQPSAILATAPFNLLPCVLLPYPQSGDCIPQRGTSRKLEALGDRLMYRLQYRNFGDHQSLIMNHTVDAGGGRAGIRWYEIRAPGGEPVIYQQGTYAPSDANHRWNGSAAMDRQGNLAIGYSVSGTNTYPSIRYAGRLVSDPLGVLAQGEATLMAGGGAQTATYGFWGEYTMLGVDPADDCTFWYTNEYYSTVTTDRWRTRIGSFRFPSCTGAPTGHLFGTVTNAGNGAPLANATVRAGAKTAVTNAAGIYQIFNLPVGTYSLSISAPGYATKTINGVAVSDRRTTTQDVVLQVAAAPTPGKGYLPLVQRPLPPTATPTPTVTPTSTPQCDSFEPNDNRATNPAGPLLSGQIYQAKLCAGDPEDNYFFTTTTGNQIQISITLPPALVKHTLLWVYDQDDLRQGQEVCKHGFITKSPLTVLCSIQNPGTYVLRLYTDSDAVFDNVNPYTFKLDFQ